MNLLWISDQFGVSVTSFCAVVREADKQSKVFTRHRKGNNICYSLNGAFLYRQINEQEYQALEALVPEMKRRDAQQNMTISSPTSDYEKIIPVWNKPSFRGFNRSLQR